MSAADESLVVGQAWREDAGECPCAEGSGLRTPVKIGNPPGLSAIAYRAGTHALFKKSMLARLSSSQLPALAGLRTREDDDFSIALLDAWATAADVLTFYQERIANESYLRTATERLSLSEMTRLIGYQLRPGVAASACLAFTLEKAPRREAGAPAGTGGYEPSWQEITLEAGVKVQSVPGPLETAQVFETVEEITARTEWNAMQPRQTRPQTLSAKMESLILKGATTNLRAGDALLIVPSAGHQELRQVIRVRPDTEADTTCIDLAIAPSAPSYSEATFTKAVLSGGRYELLGSVVRRELLGKSWDQRELMSFVATQQWSTAALDSLIARLTAKSSSDSETGVFALRQRAAIFGHNAPMLSSLPDEMQAVYAPDWENRTLSEEAGSGPYIYLDNVYPAIVPGSWLALRRPSGARVYQVEENLEISLSRFAMTAKVTRLKLDSSQGLGEFKLRETTVLAQSERLDLAEVPISEAIEGESVTLDGFYKYLEPGRLVILTGELDGQSGVTQSEVRTLEEVTLEGGFTKLKFNRGLEGRYDRSTVTINGNVARATHGETVEEVLGSGDPSRPYQRFKLKQQPLTYVSAANAAGAETTLEIRVNDLLWREVPALYGCGPRDRVYVVRTGDEGETTVQFGDGITGARPPAGQNNLRAVYRKGIGLTGVVKAGQLTQLMTRPLGVKEVANPLAASGGGDPESLDDARRNAPLAVRTLDRAVSLRDYDDFAASFAGIAKALAASIWDGRRRSVLVTVAGPEGAAVTEDSELYGNLVAALEELGDPNVAFRVKSYRKALFRITAKLTVEPEHLPDKVLAAVQDELEDRFAFEARDFGQPVTLSEVVAVIQGVEGVAAVNLKELYRSGEAAGLNSEVPAQMPALRADGEVEAAELLTLDAASLENVEVTS